MDIRPFAPADREACLAVFDSNVPDFFAAQERTGYEHFLDDPGCPYFVMDHEGAIVGCGGYRLDQDEQRASLVMGMIRRDLHGQGLGRFLLMFRLREIGKAGAIQTVRLETSLNAAGFYQSQGFRMVEEAGGRVEMIRKLAVCA